MLVIASTIPSDEMGMDYFQETNTIKLFDDCSYYNQMITRPNRYREPFRRLFSMLFPKKEWL
jgi:pyruvate dehydrogenase (quinone)